MGKLTLASVALSVFVIADFAAAADLPIYRKAPPVVVPWSWAGFYVGGNVGYSWGSAITDFAETGTATSVVTATTTGTPLPLPGNGATTTTTAAAFGRGTGAMNGWLGGAQAGYNWIIEQWVFGLEADIQATGQKEDPLFCGVPGCPIGSLFGTSTAKLPWFATFRGRIGHTWDVGPNWSPVLLYITGGLAVGEVDGTYTGGFVGGPMGVINVNSTRTGWTIGAGGETRLGQTNWTLKAEYLYMDLDNISGLVGGTGGTTVTPFGINNSDQIHLLTTTTAITGLANTHVTDQILRVGFNYKFPLH